MNIENPILASNNAKTKTLLDFESTKKPLTARKEGPENLAAAMTDRSSMVTDRSLVSTNRFLPLTDRLSELSNRYYYQILLEHKCRLVVFRQSANDIFNRQHSILEVLRPPEGPTLEAQVTINQFLALVKQDSPILPMGRVFILQAKELVLFITRIHGLLILKNLSPQDAE
ncbi:hypothetical protein LguiA_005564 [Lonicera macranthoides]